MTKKPDHVCPGPGCDRRVPHEQLACPRHWSQVPRDLQRQVWDTFRREAGSPEHLAACQAAVAEMRKASAAAPAPARPRHETGSLWPRRAGSLPTKKRFPVLWPDAREMVLQLEEAGVPRSVPWDLVDAHRVQADKNHGQSVKQLAERGGLDPAELVAVLTDRRFRDVKGTVPEIAAELLRLLEGAS